MDIRQLRYFIAIAQSSSLSSAAHSLNVAQPSLSQHLANMEQELGVRLVERSHRGSVLTEEGRIFLQYAQQICNSMEACLAEMQDLGQAVHGSVSFGMPPSVSMVMSVPLAETVRVELPEVRLKAIEAMSGYIKAWIEDETVEIAFLYDLQGVEHFEAVHVLDEQVYFFSAPDAWPLATPPGEPVRMADLAGIDMILPGRTHGLRRIVEDAAQRSGTTLNVVIEMDAMTQIKDLVARGSAYTAFAPAAVYDFVSRGELLRAPIVDPVPSRPVYLVRKPTRMMSRACRAVRDVTLDVAKDLVQRGIWEGQLYMTDGKK